MVYSTLVIKKLVKVKNGYKNSVGVEYTGIRYIHSRIFVQKIHLLRKPAPAIKSRLHQQIVFPLAFAGVIRHLELFAKKQREKVVF